MVIINVLMNVKALMQIKESYNEFAIFAIMAILSVCLSVYCFILKPVEIDAKIVTFMVGDIYLAIVLDNGIILLHPGIDMIHTFAKCILLDIFNY